MRPCVELRCSTAAPENPFKIFPSQAYVELRSAYCVAVYPRLVRLDIYATSATPAKLRLKWAPAMTGAKGGMQNPAHAAAEIAVAPAACRTPPIMSARMYPSFSEPYPPAAML